MQKQSALLNILWIVLLIFFVQSCQSQDKTSLADKGNSNTYAEVKQAITQANDYYRHGDIKWVDYYNDTYTEITPDGRSVTKYADSLRNQWTKMNKKYKVVVRKPGEPTIIASGTQALHYNTASEMFINKATNDTMDNTGTWIALWQKQNDNSWKIVLETYQASATK